MPRGFLIALLVLPSARAKPARGVYLSANVQFVPAFVALEKDYNFVKEALNPVPTEKGVELMAHWQSVAPNVQPKRPVRKYMDLRLVNEVVAQLGKK